MYGVIEFKPNYISRMKPNKTVSNYFFESFTGIQDYAWAKSRKNSDYVYFITNKDNLILGAYKNGQWIEADV